MSLTTLQSLRGFKHSLSPFFTHEMHTATLLYKNYIVTMDHKRKQVRKLSTQTAFPAKLVYTVKKEKFQPVIHEAETIHIQYTFEGSKY